MINSELLKEAIADAKAVRATALANAKAALEEAFAPRFEAMFADRLKEESEEEEEEEGLQEVEAPNQVSGKGGEARGPATKAVSKGQPSTSKKSGKDFKPVQAGKGPKGVGTLNQPIMETAEEEEEGRLDEEGEGEEEEMDECKTCGKPASLCTCDESVNEAGLTSEDLDEIIAELENEVADEEEGKRETEPAPEPPIPAPEGEPAPADGDGGEELPPAPADGGDEEPEADVTAEPGSEVDINLGPEAGAEAGAVPPAGMNAGGLEEPAPSPVPASAGDEEDDENINLEELLAALNEEADEEDEGKKREDEGKKKEEEEEEGEEEEMDEALQNDGIPTNELAGQDKTGGVKGYPSGPDASKKQLKGKNHNIGGKGNIGTPDGVGKPTMGEATQYKIALKEAYKTIEFLRGQINEVNLLNAKLLYTNKLFKEFAGVLDDTYRMKIVESFDLTKSVREVKLAYALLAESLNFGTHMTKIQSVKPVAKPISQKGQVKQITEGFASKPVSSTKPSKLITEGNEMALRFKKLAGIKDAPKTTTPEKK
jgi:hypothetical protein